MPTPTEWQAFLAARPDIDRLLDGVTDWNISANESIMLRVNQAFQEWKMEADNAENPNQG